MRVRRRSRAARATATARAHPDVAGGLAVVVAVTTLLELLRRAISKTAFSQISELWIAGRQLSQNVVGTHLLQQTVTQSRKLVDELEKHAETTEGTPR